MATDINPFRDPGTVIFLLPSSMLMTFCLIYFESEAITKRLPQTRHGVFIQGRKEERKEKAIEFSVFSENLKFPKKLL